jgi:hypothetical protein
VNLLAKEFGELVFRQGLVHLGVLLIRLEGLAATSRATLVSSAIATHAAGMMGVFTVLSPGAVRIRRPFTPNGAE